MKTAVSIPDPLFEASDELARRLGISRSELYQRALRAFVQQHRQAAVTEALNEVYGTTGETAEVDPALAAAQRAAVGQEDW